MDVFALGIPDGHFLARDHQRACAARAGVHPNVARVAFCNLLAEGFKTGQGGGRLLGVVLCQEGEIIGVIRTADEVQTDSFCRLLKNGGSGSVLDVVCGIVGVAMHLACDKACGLRRHLAKNVNAQRLWL